MEATGKQITVTGVIGEAFNTYAKYAGPLIGGAVIIVGVAAVIAALLASTGSLILSAIGGMIAFAFSFLYTGYVVKLVQDVRDGRRDSSVAELFSAASPYLVTLILNGILAGIAIAIGFVLLIVPGLILLTIWAVISPSIVVENQGVMGAFGRSRELVKGHGWTVFGIILLAGLITFAVSQIIGSLGDSVGDDAGRVIFSAAAQIVTAPVLALVSSLLFFDLGGGAEAAAPTESVEPAA